MRRIILSSVLFFPLLIFSVSICLGANYALEIANIDEVGANSRIKYAYTGIEYRVRIAARGGTYPFVWELTTNPSGMAIDAGTGVITWSNPTESGSPHNVTVKVTDDESNIDSESFTITVTTSTDRFLFVDDDASGEMDGSILKPYDQFCDVVTAANAAKIIYFRAGTYDIDFAHGNCSVNHTDQGTSLLSLYNRPRIFLEYPDETVYFDLQSADAFYCNASNDLYIYGITFLNSYNFSFKPDGIEDACWHDIIFDELSTSGTYASQAHISCQGASNDEADVQILGCTFEYDGTGAWASGVLTYGGLRMVVEDNVIDGFPDCGFQWKTYSRDNFFRHNTVKNCDVGLWIAGYTYDGVGCDDNEICFNYFYSNDVGAYTNSWRIATNQKIGTTYIYRNTVNESASGVEPFFSNIDSEDGIFTIYNNVFQNQIADTGDCNDQSWQEHRCYFDDTSCANYNNRFSFSNNLGGASGIVDASGELLPAYQAYLGTHGWQTEGSGRRVLIIISQ